MGRVLQAGVGPRVPYLAGEEYSYERGAAKLAPAEARLLKADRAAWEFFRAQAPSYQRTVTWWVVSAKKADTRRCRVEGLLAACARGQRL